MTDLVDRSAGTSPGTFFSRRFERIQSGDRWTSDPIPVEPEDVLAFADLTGDRHPLHVDPEWAATSRFGGQIAHGMLVVSLVAGAAPFDPECVVAMRGVRDVVLKRAVLAGDRIRIEGAVERLTRVDAETGLVGIRWTVRNGDGEVAARGTFEVLWRREDSA
jgi:acyl dehydratase